MIRTVLLVTDDDDSDVGAPRNETGPDSRRALLLRVIRAAYCGAPAAPSASLSFSATFTGSDSVPNPFTVSIALTASP